MINMMKFCDRLCSRVAFELLSTSFQTAAYATKIRYSDFIYQNFEQFFQLFSFFPINCNLRDIEVGLICRLHNDLYTGRKTERKTR